MFEDTVSFVLKQDIVENVDSFFTVGATFRIRMSQFQLRIKSL